jgi:hypothetical protein
MARSLLFKWIEQNRNQDYIRNCLNDWVNDATSSNQAGNLRQSTPTGPIIVLVRNMDEMFVKLKLNQTYIDDHGVKLCRRFLKEQYNISLRIYIKDTDTIDNNLSEYDLHGISSQDDPALPEDDDIESPEVDNSVLLLFSSSASHYQCLVPKSDVTNSGGHAELSEGSGDVDLSNSRDDGVSPPTCICGIDPGETNIIFGVLQSDDNKYTGKFSFKAREYYNDASITATTKNLNAMNNITIGKAMRAMKMHHLKTSNMKRLKKGVKTINTHYHAMCNEMIVRRRRAEMNFQLQRKKRSVLERKINSIQVHGYDMIIAYGDGKWVTSSKGTLKVPNKEVKRMCMMKYSCYETSEWRTSSVCYVCGEQVKKYFTAGPDEQRYMNRGILYCGSDICRNRRIKNRDQLGAADIAQVFLHEQELWSVFYGDDRQFSRFLNRGGDYNTGWRKNFGYENMVELKAPGPKHSRRLRLKLKRKRVILKNAMKRKRRNGGGDNN